MVVVPVQLIQPRRMDRGHTVVVQSVNVLLGGGVVGGLPRAELLGWLQDAMVKLLGSWLGDWGPIDLGWVGLDREDIEVAWPAESGAQVGGDPQRGFVAVDRSDRYSPWDKEEEQSLRAFQRLGSLERDVGHLQVGQDRIIGVLENMVPSVTEQFDGLMAAVEALARLRGQRDP